MSDDFESESGSLTEGEEIKNLRKQYEEAQKELRELRERDQQRAAAERAELVKAHLKAKGVPESAAKFYSGEDASSDAVGKWIEENAEVFRPASAPADPNAQAAARVSAASYGSDHGGVTVESGVGSQRFVGDPNEIARLLSSLPYEELVKQGLMPKHDPYRRPYV